MWNAGRFSPSLVAILVTYRKGKDPMKMAAEEAAAVAIAKHFYLLSRVSKQISWQVTNIVKCWQ